MAIMTKSVLLITLLVTIIAAAQVNAQLGGLLGGGLPVVGGGLPGVGGLLGGAGGLLSLVSITGQVSCSPNATVGVNGTVTAAPAFANAVVELVCGSTVLSSTTTSGSGAFALLLSPLQTLNLLGINLSGLLSPVQALLPTLLSPVCNLVVTTPLSACNPSLPSTGGFLTSPLTLIRTLLQGVLTITAFGPVGFILSSVL